MKVLFPALLIISQISFFANVFAEEEKYDPTTGAIIEYLECGCGCCDGVSPMEKCVDSKKEKIEDIKNNNPKPSTEFCAPMGCSAGTKYKYCTESEKADETLNNLFNKLKTIDIQVNSPPKSQ
jgi:hypothetical protein